MITVVRLGPEEAPPVGAMSALVVQDGGASAPVLHAQGVTFHLPRSASDVDQAVAIAQACRWAEARGLAVIYVRTGSAVDPVVKLADQTRGRVPATV